MKNILLGIIAINLTFISFNLALRSVEPVQAANSIDTEECKMIRSKAGFVMRLNKKDIKNNYNENVPLNGAVQTETLSLYYIAFCKN